MNPPLRIAITGAGQMGIAHAEAFRALGAEIVAVVDRDMERASRLAREAGGRACQSIDEALQESPDGLSICLPHSLHFDVAMKAAAKGVALLIEKPHCVSLEESRALRAACAQHQVMAMAGFTHRFLETSRRLKSTIEAGSMGRIDLVMDWLVAGALGSAHPAWYQKKALAGGGVTMIGMIHSIDRLRWLLGAEITYVTAITREADPACDVESTAVAQLEFDNGVVASLVAHRSPVPAHQRSHHYQIHGESLIAYCEVGSFSHQSLKIVGASGQREEIVTDDQPFVAEIKEFLEALSSGRPASPNLADAEVALGVVLAIYESARTRTAISMQKFLGSVSPSPSNSSRPHA